MATTIVAQIRKLPHSIIPVLGFAGLLALGSLVALAPAIEAQDGVQTADVRTFQNPDGTPIPEEERVVTGIATLSRATAGVLIEINTMMLDLGAAYSNWWVIFNNPEACSEDGCGADDLGNAAVEASVLFATGRVADAEGNATFRAFLPTGLIRFNRTIEGRERTRLGPGLQNPITAEIHYIIRNHGPAADTVPELVEQLSTFGGGCASDANPEGFACHDQQAIAFK